MGLPGWSQGMRYRIIGGMDVSMANKMHTITIPIPVTYFLLLKFLMVAMIVWMKYKANMKVKSARQILYAVLVSQRPCTSVEMMYGITIWPRDQTALVNTSKVILVFRRYSLYAASASAIAAKMEQTVKTARARINSTRKTPFFFWKNSVYR